MAENPQRPVSSTKFMAALFFLTSAVLLYLLFRENAEVREVNLNWDSTQKTSQSKITELQQQLAAAKAALAESDKHVAQLTAASARGAQTQRKNETFSLIHIADILKDHPESVPAYTRSIRRRVLDTYRDVLANLNLPPDDVTKLKDLLVQREMTPVDVRAAAENAGLEPGSAAWKAAAKQASDEVDQQITAILGKNGDLTAEDLQEMVAYQRQVRDQYNPDFAEAGIPLSPSQASGLAHALFETSNAPRFWSKRSAGYDKADPSSGLTPHDSQLLDAAAAVLSPAQLQIIKTDRIDNAQIEAMYKPYRQSGKAISFP